MNLLIVSLIGLVTGFFDALIGAGGLISVPSLVILGMDPQAAIATDRFGVIGQIMAALHRFWKAKKIVWRYVLVLTVLALFGSVIGANILLQVDEKILEDIIGVLIMILLPIVLLRKDLGVKRKNTSGVKKVIGLAVYFLVMVFAAFFGQGTGPLTIFTLSYFMGFTILEVMGTNKIPWLALSVSSVIIFAGNNLIDYSIGAVLLITMSIGSYMGAHVAVSKGDMWVKRIFAVFVVVLAIKLLFF